MKSWKTPDWTLGSYQLFRICLGLYFFILFSLLLTWSPELFSKSGAFFFSFTTPFLGVFPSLFFWLDSLQVVLILQSGAILASLLFLLGKKDRYCAFYLCFFLASAHATSPLIANPSLPYLGWILLIHSLSPTHPWPRFLRKSLWWLLVAGYSISGCYKLNNPSWIDGTALELVLQGQLSKDNILVNVLLNHPYLLRIITWVALALECLVFPLALIPTLQRWLWISTTLLHLSILPCIDFLPITLGMLLIQALACDLEWIAKASCKSPNPILLVDGDCVACSNFSRWVFQEDRLEIWKAGYLGGQTHALLDPTQERGSMLVWDGKLYRGWQAISHLLCCLGGWWYLIGKLMAFVPQKIANSLYGHLSRIRYKIPLKQSCQILPEHWKNRIMN